MVFNRKSGFVDLPVTIPCGQCIGCRLERSRQWAIRCVHEAQLHTENAFITLTYDDEHIPPGPSLVKNHFQKFIRRLRREIKPIKIRYYHCGEYGSKYGRPHYHACIFGYDFPDKKLWSTRNSIQLYRSPMLERLWPQGLSSVGNVTFESAAYVARYITKKFLGPNAAEHYERVDTDTGEILSITPEYTTMSLKPAIGKLWLEKYQTDVYPRDEIILRGRKLKPPRYYNGLYELQNPASMAAIKRDRIRAARKNATDTTPARLAVRERSKLLQTKQLIRPLE